MGLSPRDHTASVLKRMNLAGSIPGNLDRNNDAQSDNYGLTAARSSDASSFKMDGAPKSPHLGRPGRQAGGRIAGDLIRTRRTPEEKARDIASEDSLVDELGKDRSLATGGRAGRASGGVVSEAARDAENAEKVSRMSAKDRDAYANERDGGRVGRAHGGRTGKGKTTVNVIIGGDKHVPPQAPPPMPPPLMAATGPVRPPGPPPPGGPPLMGPPGGAPMGPMGAPPPGAPPMLRARGGRIEINTPGVHDYGKAGVKHGSTDEKYGGGSGLGRQERARHQK